MRRIVKHTLTVVTFVVGALCFAMFMITVKPAQCSPLTGQARALQNNGFS